MKIKSFKSSLKFWQEIAFIVSIGLFFIYVARAVMLGYIMDKSEIFLVCFILPLFICLVGQFFWKNKTLAVCLSVLLGLSSFGFILMALHFIIGTASIKLAQTVTVLIWNIFLLVAAITMPINFEATKSR